MSAFIAASIVMHWAPMEPNPVPGVDEPEPYHTTAACHPADGKQFVGADVYHPFPLPFFLPEATSAPLLDFVDDARIDRCSLRLDRRA